MAMSLHRRPADSPGVQATLADAATLIDSAALHLVRSAEAVDAASTSAAAPTLNPGLARKMYGRALVGDERPVGPTV